MTLATVQQLRICRDFGIGPRGHGEPARRPTGDRYVLGELRRDPEFDFYCVVNSVANVEQLAAAAGAASPGRPLQLLLEGGMDGGRTGCRTLETALAVARAVKAAGPHLALRGVEGFEGLVHTNSPEADAATVARFLDFSSRSPSPASGAELFAHDRLILSAGGSAFYDLVVDRFRRAGLERDFLLVTRSGCYLTHDSKMYQEAFEQVKKRKPGLDNLGPGLVPAFEVWAYVQSRPEPKKAILTVGKRDISYDVDLPVPLKWVRPRPGVAAGDIAELGAGYVVTGLNDQHCHLTVPANSPLAVGDMVAFGVSHPCTTFDKWQVIPVVDDAYTVVSAIKTYF